MDNQIVREMADTDFLMFLGNRLVSEGMDPNDVILQKLSGIILEMKKPVIHPYIEPPLEERRFIQRDTGIDGMSLLAGMALGSMEW